MLSYIHVDGDFNPQRVTAARVHGGLHPRRVHEEANLVYPTMVVAHEGLASLAVDLHEVGDLLALTNSLVQLHNLVGGSQVTPSQSRRHHSPRSNKGCVDDELLALVLQMIVSPTLNSLSQIWIWWKEDLSGNQLGKARDQDSYGRNGIS